MNRKVEGHRRRERPKLKWRDKMKYDMQERGLREEQTGDRVGWKRLAMYSDPL